MKRVKLMVGKARAFLTVVDKDGKQVSFRHLVVYVGDGKIQKFPADCDCLVHAWRTKAGKLKLMFETP
jgi:hypothetical protein